MDQNYVLGTDDAQIKVMHVKKDSKNKFIFTNAREMLGVQDKYKKLDELKAEWIKKQEGFTMKNGIQLRYSEEIGGDRNTNCEIIEWPSDEYLGNLTKDQILNFNIQKIKWVKGTHFGPEEDYCNSMIWETNN